MTARRRRVVLARDHTTARIAPLLEGTGRFEVVFFGTEDKEKACREIGIDAGRKVVGLAGTRANSLTTFDVAAKIRADVRSFFDAIASFEEPPIVILRPHPGHAFVDNGGPDEYRQIAREAGVSIEVPDVSPDMFIAASDVVVGFNSTLLVAVLMGRRVAMTIECGHPGVVEPSSLTRLPGLAVASLDAGSIAEILEGLGRDTEHVPDINLIRRLDDTHIVAYINAAELVLGGPETVNLAKRHGILALEAGFLDGLAGFRRNVLATPAVARSKQ